MIFPFIFENLFISLGFLFYSFFPGFMLQCSWKYSLFPNNTKEHIEIETMPDIKIEQKIDNPPEESQIGKWKLKEKIEIFFS